MKVLGVIPARGGSKGVPRKNIKDLKGKPLIGYTIDAALNSILDRVIVSTDDKEISEIANKLGVETPFTRPKDLASDTASSIDVAVHALNEMEKIDGVMYDAFMLLQPTTPYRASKDINLAIEKLQRSDADSVISVVDVEASHPARMKYMRKGKLVDPPFCEAYENQNRQELEPMYIRNGAIYLTRRETLLKKSYKGENCEGLIMPPERSVNIDTLSDFEYAEWIYGKKGL
ncbi:acylneuraminate cytidylyltransferase family protein [Pseudotenacibaculum sp. MALMAid0570]|uniref:acylneuraminate cytidylyltransferase family protein n=1 Tax=Pseudotenacibaculum sp. MALMAid0570 TaxID=3143938 RepID=UPI0032E028A7